METHSKYFFNTNMQRNKDSESDLIIVCDNFSTPENIGSIVRLAANVKVSKLIVIGSEECRQSKIKKTAGAALGHIQLQYCNKDNFIDHIPSAYTIVALETIDGARDLYQEILPKKMALVLGNEKFGVSKDVLMYCNNYVYIPMPGPIKSMNVSHAASVCAFEWLRQHLDA